MFKHLNPTLNHRNHLNPTLNHAGCNCTSRRHSDRRDGRAERHDRYADGVCLEESFVQDRPDRRHGIERVLHWETGQRRHMGRRLWWTPPSNDQHGMGSFRRQWSLGIHPHRVRSRHWCQFLKSRTPVVSVPIINHFDWSYYTIDAHFYICRYEKMISGMYMGEVTRLVLAQLTREGLLFDGMGPEMLFEPGQFFTKYLSEIERWLYLL